MITAITAITVIPVITAGTVMIRTIPEAMPVMDIIPVRMPSLMRILTEYSVRLQISLITGSSMMHGIY